jgi:16S rRNA (cytosine1402-N4)-methyltransferase
VIEELGWNAVDGIVLDLGVSFLQLSKPERGFSFLRDGPLDMRMDTRKGETAASLLKRLSASEMAEIFWDFGEEPESKRVARAIVAERSRTPLTSTRELARLVDRVVRRRGRTHPATRIFQALRIAVNGELDELKRFLATAPALLRPDGVLAIVSFHSLEDRIVKREFQKWGKNCLCPPGVPVCTCGWSRKAVSLFRKAVKPAREEIQKNPRARSARLRAVRRVECEV